MARIAIPPKTTLVVGMPSTLFRALLLSKAALQDELFAAFHTRNCEAAPPGKAVLVDALAAVNLVLGLPNDHVVTSAQLLKMAESA